MTDTDGAKQLAAALGRIPSGLFVVTCREGDRETGLLASFVQQCAFQPPLVSLAIKQGRALFDWLVPGKLLTINILDDTQTDMIAHFGRGFGLDDSPFEELDVDRPEDAGAILRDCLACLHVRVAQRIPTGDHELILAEVVAGQLLGEGHPMVHVRKSGMHY
jgi:flavin reductase (DIM6/NTAB) family NADH-FMN oxidoreductase RutF